MTRLRLRRHTPAYAGPWTIAAFKANDRMPRVLTEFGRREDADQYYAVVVADGLRGAFVSWTMFNGTVSDYYKHLERS